MTTPIATMTEAELEERIQVLVDELPEPMRLLVHTLKDEILDPVRKHKELGEMAFALASIELTKD